MSPAQAVRNGAKAAANNPWIIVIAFMFQGGVLVSLVAGALWLGDLNRIVLRNATDIAAHSTDKPHPNAEARLRVLEAVARDIRVELIALRTELQRVRALP